MIAIQTVMVQAQLITRSLSTPINITGEPLPVELTFFTASMSGTNVKLHWQTETEVNNYGFEVLRLYQNEDNWEKIGFVGGNGNSNSPKDIPIH